MLARLVRGVSSGSSGHGAVGGDGDGAILHRLRILMLLLVAFGALGLTTELVLLEHGHAWPQRAPRGLLATFRLLMALSLASGVIGASFHIRSNALLELEIDPRLSVGPLVPAALSGGTPALAPGAMVQWGILGLLAVFRHPAGRG